MSGTASSFSTADTERLILLAEDEPANITLYKTVLSRAGYQVDVAEDGPSAVEQASARRYGLILMDLGLPLYDGIEATQRIRIGDGPNLAAPIVALTADDDQQTRRACAAIGFVNFLVKPLGPADLLNEVAAYFGETVH
ncbi:MAG: response regulator [Rhodobacteraceae bacterium]|nr:response regulator [Paracoccaceae bacterium]